MNFIMGEVGYFLAQKFDAALALYFTGMVSFVSLDNAIGQPHNSAYLPMPLFDFSNEMTFFQRTQNFLATQAMSFMRDYYAIYRVNRLLEREFPGERIPDLMQIERNASVGFSFGHPLLMDGWRPIVYNFVNLGMMNCRKASRDFEDKELQKFLDGAKKGVIYVSFGSVLKASEMSDERRDMFLEVFQSLEQKVLWKWETESMPNLPANVMLKSWLPQQDVLGHPNVKMFISHGGQSSFQETLCHQKPAVRHDWFFASSF